jgi:hypothetical protein
MNRFQRVLAAAVSGLALCSAAQAYELHLYIPGMKAEPQAAPAPSYLASCLAIKQANPTSADGIYQVAPAGSAVSPVSVYCDMTTDGGGWSLVFAGVNSDSSAHDLTFADVTTGQPMVTYTNTAATRPVLPTGLTNTYSQAMFKGGTSTWTGKMGAWVRFSMFTASNGLVPVAYSGVKTASGLTSLWSTTAGWGGANGTTAVTSALSLWDAGGVSPICGGNFSPAGKNCPIFLNSETTYPYHYDTSTYRELYVR